MSDEKEFVPSPLLDEIFKSDDNWERVEDDDGPGLKLRPEVNKQRLLEAHAKNVEARGGRNVTIGDDSVQYEADVELDYAEPTDSEFIAYTILRMAREAVQRRSLAIENAWRRLAGREKVSRDGQARDIVGGAAGTTGGIERWTFDGAGIADWQVEDAGVLAKLVVEAIRTKPAILEVVGGLPDDAVSKVTVVFEEYLSTPGKKRSGKAILYAALRALDLGRDAAKNVTRNA